MVFRNSVIAIVATIIVVALLFIAEDKFTDKNSQANVKINNTKINVEIVTTEKDQNKGLSDRESLADKTGMLFAFDNYKIRSFWMRIMQFPLDLIWIKDTDIIGITKNVPVPVKGTSLDDLPQYFSPDLVNYVLEVNAGFSDNNNIEVGDKVEFSFN